MGKIGDLFVRLGVKLEDFKRGMADAKKQVDGFLGKLSNMKAGALAMWGAIGVGVTKFAISFRDATNKMGDAWNEAVGGWKASWHSFLADLSNADLSLKGKGGLAGIFKNEVAWWKRIFGNAKEAADAARKMTNAFDAEFELEQSVKLQRQAVQHQLNDLYVKLSNTTLSTIDRKAAADQYKKILQPIADAEDAVYQNMLNAAVDAWQAGNELDRQYSTDELKEFFSKIGTAYEEMEKKFPDLMRVYETRKGDAQNLVIFDTIGKLQTALNQMSDIDRVLARKELSIDLQAEKEFYINGKDSKVWAGTTINEVKEYFAELQRDINKEIKQEIADSYDPIEHSFVNIDMSAVDDDLNAWLTKWEDTVEKTKALNLALEDSIIQATAGSMEAFTDMLFGLEGADASAILGALMQPFADTAGQLGGMLLAQGIAVEAFKTSLESLQGAPAIAAGLSLLAISAAMKSGIKALAKGGSGAGSAASYGGGSYGGSMVENYESTLTVNVVGHISGSDILLSLDRTRNKQRR